MAPIGPAPPTETFSFFGKDSRSISGFAHLRNRRPRPLRLHHHGVSGRRDVETSGFTSSYGIGRMLTVTIDVALPNEGHRDYHHASGNF